MDEWIANYKNMILECATNPNQMHIQTPRNSPTTHASYRTYIVVSVLQSEYIYEESAMCVCDALYGNDNVFVPNGQS